MATVTAAGVSRLSTVLPPAEFSADADPGIDESVPIEDRSFAAAKPGSLMASRALPLDDFADGRWTTVTAAAIVAAVTLEEAPVHAASEL